MSDQQQQQPAETVPEQRPERKGPPDISTL
jgi:hypothetical protein